MDRVKLKKQNTSGPGYLPPHNKEISLAPKALLNEANYELVKHIPFAVNNDKS